MRRTFKTVDYAQALDLTVRLGDCLPPDHLAHFVVEVWLRLTSRRSTPIMDRPRVFRALGAAHIVRAILLLVIAALLAYALAPGVKLLQRVMPRFLAILIMYLIVLGAVSFLLYLIITTAIDQIGSLTITVQKLLTPGSGRQLSPIEQALSTLVVSIMSMYHTLIISTFASGVLFSLCLIFDSISVLGLFSLKQRVERRVS